MAPVARVSLILSSPPSLLSWTNMDPPAPAASKPIKREESLSLDNLFDDLDADAKFEIPDDVKKSLPTVKKPGSWQSENVDSMAVQVQKMS